jgi:hypothetical protein
MFMHLAAALSAVVRMLETQPVPESLIIQIADKDLTYRSRERIKVYNEQSVLPVSLIRENQGIVARESAQCRMN